MSVPHRDSPHLRLALRLAALFSLSAVVFVATPFLASNFSGNASVDSGLQVALADIQDWLTLTVTTDLSTTICEAVACKAKGIADILKACLEHEGFLNVTITDLGGGGWLLEFDPPPLDTINDVSPTGQSGDCGLIWPDWGITSGTGWIELSN